MPNKKNNSSSRGRKKLQHRELHATVEDALGRSFDEDDPRIDELQEIFSSRIDREIIQAVLIECDGDLSEATEKLFDLLNDGQGERSNLTEQTDLAVIACSLLSEDNITGVSTLNVYEDSHVAADVGSTPTDYFQNANPEQSPYSTDSGDSPFPSASGPSDINEFVKGSGILTESVSDANRINALASCAVGGNKNEKAKSKSFSTAVDETETHSSNRYSKNTVINNISDRQPSSSVVADAACCKFPHKQMSKNLSTVDDSEQKKVLDKNAALFTVHTVSKKNKQSVLNVGKQKPELLEAAGRDSDEWSRFYKDFDQILNIPKQPYSAETNFDDLFFTGPLGYFGTVNNQQHGNLEYAKTEELKRDIEGTNLNLTGLDLRVVEKGDSQTGSAMSSKSIDLASTEASVGLNQKGKSGASIPSSNLSAESLEFVPRSLASRQSMSGGQNKSKKSAMEAKNPPKPLKPLPVGGQKLKTINKGKKKNKVNTQGRGYDPQTEQHQQPFVQPHISKFNTAGEEISVLNSKNDFDPMDPLGWNDLFTAPSLADPKPQRAQKMKKMPTYPKEHINAKFPDPAQSAGKTTAASIATDITDSHGMDSGTKLFSGGGKPAPGNVFKHPLSAGMVADDPWQLSASGWNGTKFLNSFSMWNSSSPHNPSPFSMAPSSSYSSARPLVNNTDSHRRYEQKGSIAPTASFPKNMHNLHSVPPSRSRSSPSIATEPVFIKNKLSFQRVTGPVGIIKQYVLQKQTVMVILRGLPGSGKSYLAKHLLGVCKQMGVGGIVLSTDDYFEWQGNYQFDRNHLSAAHDWNKKRALHCLKESVSPIFIDNTNTELWELLPYAVIALDYRYDVQLFEPDTSWKMKVGELTKRNSHGVAHDAIKRMKDRYQKLSTDDVLRAASKSIADRNTSKVTTFEDMTSIPGNQESRQGMKTATENRPFSFGNQPQMKVTQQPKAQAQESSEGQNIYSEIPSFDLGPADWADSGPAPQRSPKKQKKKNLKSKEQNKPKDEEITKDGSLEKGMVNFSNSGTNEAAKVEEIDVNDTGIDQEDFIQEIPPFVRDSDCTAPSVDDAETGIPSAREELRTTDEVPELLTKSHKTDDDEEASVRQLDGSVSTTSSYKSCYSDLSEKKGQDGTCDDDGSDLNSFYDALLDQASVEEPEERMKLYLETALQASASPEKDDEEEIETPVTVIEPPAFAFPQETSQVVVKQAEFEAEESKKLQKDSIDDVDVENCDDFLYRANELSKADTGNVSHDRLEQKDSEESMGGVDQALESNQSLPVMEKGDETDNSMTVKLTNVTRSQASYPSSLVEYSDSDESENDVARQVELHSPRDPDTNENITEACEEPQPGTEDGLRPETEIGQLETNLNDPVALNKSKESVQEISKESATNSTESSTLSSREQSPLCETSGNSGSPIAKSRKKKRVKPGRHHDPFIEDSVKEKSKTENWNSFLGQLPSNTKNIEEIIPPTERTDPPATKVSTATQSDSYYFSIVYKVNSVSFNDHQPLDLSLSDEKVLQSSPYSVMVERWGNSGNSDATIVKSGGTIDRSTLTDEALEKEEIDMVILQTCFPEYSRKHLDDIMNICDNDLEWVSTHLLESPAVFDMEDENGAEEELQTHSIDLSSGYGTGASSPSLVRSLADLCGSVVQQTKIVDADDLEMQVIKAGEERLMQIENYGRSKLHSVGDENLGQNYWPDDFNLEDFSGAASLSQVLSPDQNLKKNKKLTEENVDSSKNDFALSRALSENSFEMPQASQVSYTRPSQDYHSGAASAGFLHERGMEPTVSVSQPVAIPSDFVKCLESLYGPLNLPVGSDGLLLDDHIARKIHNCLKLQGAKNVMKTVVQGPDQLQVQRDEAYARQLQEQENAQMSQMSYGGNGTPLQSSVPGWTNQRPSWMSVGETIGSATVNEYPQNPGKSSPSVSVSETLHRLRGTGGAKTRPYKFQRRMPKPTVHSVWGGGKRKPGATDSLLSIMQEEEMREKQVREQLHNLQLSGDHQALATKIKRTQLAQLFPTVGSHLLEEIFTDTGYSFDKTVSVLEETYNITRATLPKEKDDEIMRDALQLSSMEYRQALADADAEEDFSYTEGTELTYEALRNEAQFYRGLAKDCQEKAQGYHARGMHVAAFVFRQKAKNYKDEEYDANHRAADVLFEKGRERLEKENTLDLHLYHLDEAIQAVNVAIAQKESLYLRKPDKKNSYLNVVTGWGKNSRGGIPKLKPAIMNHLRDRCLRFEEKTGMLRVYLGQRG